MTYISRLLLDQSEREAECVMTDSDTIPDIHSFCQVQYSQKSRRKENNVQIGKTVLVLWSPVGKCRPQPFPGQENVNQGKGSPQFNSRLCSGISRGIYSSTFV